MEAAPAPRFGVAAETRARLYTVRMRFLVVIFALSACAASSRNGDVPGDDHDGPVEEDDGEPESERSRLVRIATEKREQCQTLGYAIETAESSGQEFVNLNDERALTRVARSRNDTAARIAGMKLSSEALLPIRDDYVAMNRNMAEALRITATSKRDAEKKASLSRYRELEKEVETIIDRFNSACDGS
jgi:hypothetical protein